MGTLILISVLVAKQLLVRKDRRCLREAANGRCVLPAIVETIAKA